METYFRLLYKAPEIPPVLNYNLNAGEMNPQIFVEFVHILTQQKLPLVIWEPFAGTSFTGSSKRSTIHDIAEEEGVTLVSYGLDPADPRISIADSTVKGPNCTIGGMLFHPPYYGTMPLSKDRRDLSLAQDKSEYTRKLGLVIDNSIPFMVPKGLVCAVGRDYRVGGNRCQLNLIFLQLFESRGFVLRGVWKSMPDVVMVLCNEG